jgi:hypothetical protein
MAVEGGTRSAYKMRLVDGELKIESTTAMRTPPPLPAMATILNGGTAIVGGFDSAVVSKLVTQAQEIERLKSSAIHLPAWVMRLRGAGLGRTLMELIGE